MPAGVKRIAISFRGISFKTRPGGMKYFYQLVGKDADWRGPTNEEIVEYFNLEPGAYSFRVQAVDRDLNYSEVAIITFTTRPDLRDVRITELELDLAAKNQQLEVRVQELEAAYGQLQRTHDELKRTQAELVQAEKMVSLGQLVAGVAHEINNPVNIISSALPSNEILTSSLQSLVN